MRIPTPRSVTSRLLVPACAAVLLAACGSGAPEPTVSAPIAERDDTTLRIGDTTARASVLQTSRLEPSVAERYGIERDDAMVMLLVGVRQGESAAERSLPARVEASVTDLRGRRQAIAMRELQAGELLDYIGTVRVDLPDTLRFEVRITPEGREAATMQFNREFVPD